MAMGENTPWLPVSSIWSAGLYSDIHLWLSAVLGPVLALLRPYQVDQGQGAKRERISGPPIPTPSRADPLLSAVYMGSCITQDCVANRNFDNLLSDTIMLLFNLNQTVTRFSGKSSIAPDCRETKAQRDQTLGYFYSHFYQPKVAVTHRVCQPLCMGWGRGQSMRGNRGINYTLGE